MKPYALIYIEGYPGVFRTITDKIHGSNPVWESAFKFKLQPPFIGEANVVFDIRHQSWTRIDRRMGKVRIPLQHFLSGDANADRVSHALHLSNKVVMGGISLSHKLNIISPSTPPANVPAIEISNDTPRPSRFSFETIRGLSNCFIVVQGVTELISALN
ncbi:16 kDa phloem protein 1-like protein [Tanacetum coccineum]